MRWRAFPLPARDQGPMPYGGKHSRLAYDPARGQLLHTGGDIGQITDDGNNEVWAGREGAWQRVHAMCGAPGAIVPARPDNCTWTVDTRRDRALIAPGFFFGPAVYQRYCGTAGATPIQSALAFNLATRTWEQPGFPVPPWGYGGDTGANFGFYDPTADALCRFKWDGAWGATYERVRCATGQWSKINLGAAQQDGGPVGGTYDGDLRNVGVTTSQSAVDVAGRTAYCIGRAANSGIWYLLPVNLDSGRTWRIPIPTTIGFVPPAAESGGGTDILLQFDPVSRVLLHPMIPNLGGEVLGVLIRHVETGQWEMDRDLPTAPPWVVGNVCGFDGGTTDLVLMGGHEIASVLRPGTMVPRPTVSWRYHYAPASSVTRPVIGQIRRV